MVTSMNEIYEPDPFDRFRKGSYGLLLNELIKILGWSVG